MNIFCRRCDLAFCSLHIDEHQTFDPDHSHATELKPSIPCCVCTGLVKPDNVRSISPDTPDGPDPDATVKLGVATARVIDRMEKYAEKGILDGYTLDHVLVVCAFSRPDPRDDDLEPDAMESFLFVDGTTQVPYIQLGILELAMDTATNPEHRRDG